VPDISGRNGIVSRIISRSTLLTRVEKGLFQKRSSPFLKIFFLAIYIISWAVRNAYSIFLGKDGDSNN